MDENLQEIKEKKEEKKTDNIMQVLMEITLKKRIKPMNNNRTQP